MSDEPRAYTEEEIREQFLRHVYHIVKYWAELPNKTDFEKCDGVAFSILSALDGSSCAVPGFKVTPSTHPGDKEYYIGKGENWYPDDVDIGGCLHELLGKYK